MNFFEILVKASRIWWQSWIAMMLMGIVWLLLQIPIVTGPPATAVFFAIAQKIYDDELWDVQDLWQQFRTLFFPSWRWALPNLLLALVVVGNFYAYRDFEGNLWIALRILWGVVALAWVLLNLHFWPFWLAQADKSLKTTYQNVFRFFLLHPWTVITLLGLATVMTFTGLFYILPLVIGGMGWIVLLLITAVQTSLSGQAISR